jgi:Uma2 family endonuclease
MVVCGPAPDRAYETDPALVIEVLSRPTANLDRRENALAYAAAPTLRLLLLVDPDERRIEAASPAEGKVQSWTLYGSGDVVPTQFGDLHIDALYDELDTIATAT